MNLHISPKPLNGKIAAISSKSDAHRALICAALAEGKTKLKIDNTSRDIEATISCIEALGGKVEKNGSFFDVTPIKRGTFSPTLDCYESGSTLRFLFPVANLVSTNPTFIGRGRLPERPLSPLREEMEKNGVEIEGKMLPITTKGTLKGGIYRLAGNISSQFISGLLFALPLCESDSKIVLTTPLESKGYVEMTLSTLKQFGINIEQGHNEYIIKGNQKYISPKTLTIEGDWSNAAFWLCGGAISGEIKCTGLNHDSNQGDKQIVSVLEKFGAEVIRSANDVTIKKADLKGINLDCTDIPDLVPIISAVASLAEGQTLLTGLERLKIKESDRLSAVYNTLINLGADAKISDNSLIITGKKELSGGNAEGFNDHRMVMMSSILASRCKEGVNITDCEAVNKSYPDFFEHLKELGGAFYVI